MSSSVPRAIGVIMDGNRRWAARERMSVLEGHQAGARKVSELAGWAHTAGIREVIVYAFSTENWNRAESEVGNLMALAEHLFTEELARFENSKVRIRFIGDRTRVSTRMQEVMRLAEDRTAYGTVGTLAFAFSYGGRAEILAAVNRLLLEGKGSVGEEAFKNAMWSAGLEDPDLILRTGGEHRLSNFLPWQSTYSELFFTDTLWPDLSEEEFAGILSAYESRERRHGK